MPIKEGGGNKPQQYDKDTGKYVKFNHFAKPRDYDKEINELKQQQVGLSFFNPKRGELTQKIKELEAQREGFNSYDEYLADIRRKNAEREQKMAKTQEKNQQENYMMSHRPTESGITADNLINQDVEAPMPNNFYEILNKDARTNAYTRETMEQLNRIRNNPDAEITIYRATIGNSINDGDWITLSPSYANTHNLHSLKGKGKVLKMKVKAKDIQYAGDNIAEWGYFPSRKGE